MNRAQADEGRPNSLLRRLFTGTATFALAEFGARAVGFTLVPVFSRYLTPGEYGIVHLAEGVAAIVGVLIFAGVPASVRRLWFKYEDDRAGFVGGALGLLMTLAALGGALFLLFGDAVIKAISPEWDVPFYPFIALAFATVVAQVFFEVRLSVLVVEERASRYAAWKVTQLLAAAALGLTAVLAGFGAGGLLAGRTVAATTAAIAAIAVLASRYRPRVSKEVWRGILVFSSPLVFHQLIAFVLTFSDRLFIEYFASVHEVGLYSTAYVVGSVMSMATVALSLGWTPMYFRLAGAENRSALVAGSHALLGVLTAIAGFGMIWVQPVFELVMDASYREASALPIYVIFGLLFHGVFTIFQLALLQAESTRTIALATVTAAIVNIALNYVLIPTHGMVGAAIATIVAYMLEALATFIAAQAIFRMKYSPALLLAPGVIAGLVGAIALSGPAGWLRVVVTIAMLLCVAFLYRNEVRALATSGQEPG